MKCKIIGELLEIVVEITNFRKFAIYPPLNIFDQEYIRESVGILLELTWPK